MTELPSGDEAPRRRGRITTAAAGGRTADLTLLERPARGDVAGDPWRALRILSEFVEGFDALASIPPAVSVFGSARVAADDPVYALAREFGGAAAQAGFAVITGGGPGVMEAANRGCHEAGGVSSSRRSRSSRPGRSCTSPSCWSTRPTGVAWSTGCVSASWPTAASRRRT